MPGDVFFVLSGWNELEEKIKYIRKRLKGKKLLNEIGMFVLTTVKRRTLAGEDVSGNAFAPYSNGYALFRKKAGYQIDDVDLTLTGTMLSAMTYETTDDEVRAFFLPTKDSTGTSNPEKAFSLNQDREFFALSTSDVNNIMDLVDDYYEKLVNGKI